MHRIRNPMLRPMVSPTPRPSPPPASSEDGAVACGTVVVVRSLLPSWPLMLSTLMGVETRFLLLRVEFTGSARVVARSLVDMLPVEPSAGSVAYTTDPIIPQAHTIQYRGIKSV